MEEKTKNMIYVMKEIFKLSRDKETNSVNIDKITKLAEKLAAELPEKDVNELLSQINEEKNKESKMYIIKFHCQNCDDASKWAIPFGTPVEEYMSDKTCKSCGCNLLQEEINDGDE